MAAYGSNEDINIIIETGGTEYWQNEIVDGSQSQRYKVTKDDIELISNEGLKKTLETLKLYMTLLFGQLIIILQTSMFLIYGIMVAGHYMAMEVMITLR